jgi:hypothetical protein
MPVNERINPFARPAKAAAAATVARSNAPAEAHAPTPAAAGGPTNRHLTLLEKAQAARDRQKGAAPAPTASAPTPVMQGGGSPRRAGFGSFKVAPSHAADELEDAPPVSERRAPAHAPAPAVAPIGGFGRFAANAQRRAPGRLPPDPDWADDETPPGSMFTRSEWQAARREGEDANGGKPIYLVEIRNAGQSAFLTLPAQPAPVVKKTRGPKGQVIEEVVPPSEEERRGCFDGTIGFIIDGCLLLAPSADTTHPECASHSSMKFSTPTFGVMEYRVARPRAHMSTERAIFSTTRMTQPYPLVEPPYEPMSDADWNAEHERERQRG